MPRSEQFEKNIRNFAHVFQGCVDLLENHFAARRVSPGVGSARPRPDRDLRAGLLQRVDYHFHLGQGYLEQCRYLQLAGALEAADDNFQLADKNQVAALIYASAARKANRDMAGHVLNRRAEDRLASVRRRILLEPADRPRLEQLQAHIDIAEHRGWQRCDGDTRLMMFIGATWCPDTVNVVDIMRCFDIPMHILIMDEDNQDEQGYLKFSDHALLAIKPDPDTQRLRVPVMIFPDGQRLIEPKPREFVIELVKHKII